MLICIEKHSTRALNVGWLEQLSYHSSVLHISLYSIKRVL